MDISYCHIPLEIIYQTIFVLEKFLRDTPEFEQAEKEVKEKIDFFINNNGSKSVDHFHKRLGKIMWNKVGMSRNEKGLKEAIAEIKALREEFWKEVTVPGAADTYNEQLAKAGRVADFLGVGRIVCQRCFGKKRILWRSFP